MIKLHGALFAIIFLSGLGICLNFKKSYTAAVVDYVHHYADYAKELLFVNVEEYLKLMRNASREYADIIVFPEYGLVDIYMMYNVTNGTGKNLDEYSTFIPDPELELAPCDDKKMENFSMHLVNLSCAARIHNMYTVVNLPEKVRNNETGKLEFHNTNVVFDRYGTVIARYRKIKLSEEPFFKPGNELVTFETDFGVTFGIFTCFDILFQFPALELLSDPNVTDIIFPTAWYSETPFLQALSIQHGYVKANGVNFLSAGLQEPFNQDGGSAIFLANGAIAESYITNNRVTKVIVQEVPIIENRMPASMCLDAAPNVTIKEMQKKAEESTKAARLNNIDEFPITRENMSGYVFDALDNSRKTIKEVCTSEKQFCCTFNITVDWSSPVDPDYTYMLAVFEGLSVYGSTIRGGIRICALLICSNESDSSSCGLRTNTSMTSIKFENIQIETTVDKTNNRYYQPTTLKSDLTPILEYVYCETDVNNNTQTHITMTTTAPQESFVTFGLYGRIYYKDMIITPPPAPKIEPLNYTLIIMIVSFSVIIMICTGGLLYKCCVKEN